MRLRRIPLRLAVPAVVLVAAVAWGVAATRGLQVGAIYYYTPSELSAQEGPSGVIRVGGQVRPGSVRWDAGAGVLRFMLADGKAAIPVVNRGAPPQLFRAGNGAVVEGRLVGGVLRSSQVIVAHDEEYRAPETTEDPPPEPAARSSPESGCRCPMSERGRAGPVDSSTPRPGP